MPMPINAAGAVAAAIHSKEGGKNCPSNVFLCDGGDSCVHRQHVQGTSSNGEESSVIPEAYDIDGGALEEGTDEGDSAVVQELYRKVKHSKEHVENYLALLGFVLLAALYLAILYLQADSLKTFQVSTSHRSLLPEGLTDQGGFTFSTTNDIYTWINDSIIQTIWEDPDCGNGICERPAEFAAFGDFGCPSDCGQNPNVSEIIVSFTLSIPTEEARLLTSWNLCMDYPDTFCWFQENEVFSRQVGVVDRSLFIPDGNWSLVLNAPFGGVTGSIKYNGTYAWDSPTKVEQGGDLVSWESCAKNESKTDLGVCRYMAGTIVNCAFESCTLFGVSLSSAYQTSGLFVDLVGLCNADFQALDKFVGMTCAEVITELTTNSTGGFQTLSCNVSNAGSSRKLLQATSNPWDYVKSFFSHADEFSSTADFPAERRMALAELLTYPGAYTSTLWENLGPTDAQRLFNLKVATQRAMFTWVGHSCLASAPVRTNANVTARFVAFFCTYFGGPQSFEGCQYTSSLSNLVLTTDAELAEEMKRIHARYNLSREQSDAFTNVFIVALQSVLEFDDTTLANFNDRMRQLDTEVVSATSSGCPFIAVSFPWSTGQIYEKTSVFKGDTVTWVWSDDDPHSIRLDTGFGNSPTEIFLGMGGSELIVSRNSVCSIQNIGSGDITQDPNPCVLQEPGTRNNRFSYSYTFSEPGTFLYSDARSPDTTYGSILVSERQTGIVGSSPLDTECASGCSIGFLRNGICNPACNNPACSYDGGDCSCPVNTFGISQCTCPPNQARAVDGSCCESFGVGVGLTFRFSIATWGPNVTLSDSNFLPQDSPPLFRYVSSHNRVLVGMAISQTRWRTAACKDKRFLSLFPNCTEGASSRNYGVNPVFLPKSVLFNEAFARNSTSYYSNFSLGFDNATLKNSQGIPFAFEAFQFQRKPTFSYIFDINYNNRQATEALQYLKDGFFIDNATKSVEVRLVTFNGLVGKFTLFKVLLTFQQGGKVPASFDIQAVTAEPYQSDLDWFRLILELCFVLCVLYNIFEEVKEYIKTYRRERTFYAHFTYFWNVLDFISLSIFIATIALWTRYALTLARPFDIDLRYEIYDISSMDEPGQYWNIVPPGKDFAQALSAFQRVEALAYFRTYYTAMNGMSILLVVLRTLKLMDFQPRMGTITRTVGAAAPDLVHFFILFFVVFFGFAMYGHLVFGRTLDQFRTLAVSLVTCFSSMLGNDSVNDFLIQLRGWELVSAVIFWWSFIIIMTFIIFNILIAIIVEAFIKVREAFDEAPSMPAEVAWIMQNRLQRLFTPIRTDKELLRQLRAMGADKAAELQFEREAWLAKSKRSESEKDDDDSNDVMVIGGQEFTLEALEAILERAAARELENEENTRKCSLEPKDLAKVIFDQHRKEASDGEESSEEEEEGGDDVEELLESVEKMKTDMAEMTSLVKELVDTVAAVKASRVQT